VETVDKGDSPAFSRKNVDKTYPPAGKTVDGRTVLDDVPNMSSIEASVTDPETLDGVREVRMDLFDLDEAPLADDEATLELADQIKRSKEIKPLIVGVDNLGPYIIEGAHRYDALKVLGAKSFPAVVALDDANGDPRFSRKPTRDEVEEEVRAVEGLQEQMMRARAEMRDLKPKQQLERAKIQLAIAQYKKDQHEQILQAIYDYGRNLGVSEAVKTGLAAAMKNTKTPAALRKALNVMDERYQRLQEKREHRNAKERLRKAIKSIPGKMRPEYKEKVNELLEGVDLSKMTPRTRGRLLQVQQLMAEGMDLPEDLQDKTKRLYRTPVSEMSTEEIDQITKAIQQTLKMHQLKNKLLSAKRWRDYGEVLTQATENLEKAPSIKKIDEVFSDRPIKERTRVSKGAERIWDMTVGIEADNPELIIERIEGMDVDDAKAVIGQTLYGNIDHAETERLRVLQMVEDELRERFQDLDHDTLSNLFAGQDKDVSVEIALPKKRTIKMSPSHRMSLYLHSKNGHNLKAFLENGIYFDTALDNKAIRLDEGDIAAIVESMTDQEREIADYVSEVLNGLNKQLINGTSRELLGYDIATVDNYYRLMRKNVYRRYLDREGRPEDFGAYINQTLENSGSLKERSPYAQGGVVLEDVFRSFYDSLNLAASYHAYSGRLRSAKQVLQDIEPTMRKTGRLKEWKALQKYIRDMEGQATTPMLTAEQLARGWFSRSVVGALGVNPVVMIRQTASLPFALMEIEGKYLAPGSAKMPMGKEMRELKERLRKYSPQLRARIDGQQVSVELGGRALGNEIARFWGKKPGWLDKQTAGISSLDAAVIIRAWGAAEAKVAAERPDLTGDEKWERVAHIAEKVTRRTQPMYSHKDRSEVARSKSLWVRLATSFTSVTNQILHMYKREWLRYERSEKTGADKRKMAQNMGVIWAASTLAMVAIDEARDRLFGREPEWADRIKRVVRYSFSPIYFARTLIGATEDLIETVASGRFSTWSTERASQNLISGILLDAQQGIRDMVYAIDPDRPMSEWDMEQFGRGVERLADQLLKVTTGIALRNIITYGYRMPKKMTERLIPGLMERNDALDLVKRPRSEMDKLAVVEYYISQDTEGKREFREALEKKHGKQYVKRLDAMLGSQVPKRRKSGKHKGRVLSDVDVKYINKFDALRKEHAEGKLTDAGLKARTKALQKEYEKVLEKRAELGNK